MPGPEDAPPPPLDKDDRLVATILAMGVRNALENLHGGPDHGPHDLTDEQMALINPIVRNAIATGLHALSNYTSHEGAREYWDFQAMLIPSYWEPAELLPKSWAHVGDDAWDERDLVEADYEIDDDGPCPTE